MKRILLFALLFALGSTSFAQERNVTGTVTAEEDGTPIPGVNVIVKGSSTGTVTDIDGRYTIQVPIDDGILIFSFIGLATEEVVIGSQSVIDMVMTADIKQLTEIIVTGYSEQDEKAITGSIATVQKEAFEQKAQIGDVSRLLQGNVPGLQSFGAQGAPGAASQTRIRGIGSVSASSEPLYIIDGIPFQTQDLDPNTQFASNSDGNPLNLINPNDIETVTVLKDAASTAVYGSRGSNGVILITTKSGRQGKTNIDFKAQYGFSDRAYYQWKNLNAQQYVTLRAESALNADPSISLDSAFNFAGSDAIDHDWSDDIYRTGITQSYDLSASGGNEKTRFFASANYFDQQGIVIRTDLKRLTTRLNLDHSINDKVDIGLNFLGGYTTRDPVTNSSTFNNPVLQNILLDPNAPTYNEDGTYFTDFNSILGGGLFNPIAIRDLDTRKEDQYRLLGKMYFAWDVIKGLKFRTDFSVDVLIEDQLIHQNTTYGDARTVNGRTTTQNQLSRIWNWTNNLTYTKTFADVHNMTLIGVYEALTRRWDDRESSITGFPNDDLPNPSNGATPENTLGRGTESSLAGFMLIGRYDYKGKYFFSGSIRRDGSSRFGDDVKYGNFWSVGAGWLISDEGFMANAGGVNILKLRFSVGDTGNEDIDDFESKGLYGTTTYNGQSGFNPTQISNPELTWERKRKYNIGIDYGFINNRINGQIDLYSETTTDLLFAVPVSRTTGFNEVETNAASLNNSGVEFIVNTVNIETNNFRWTTSFNISFNRNETKKIGGTNEPLVEGTKRRTVGRDWSEFFLARYAGVDPATGKPLWYDTLGNIVDRYDANFRVMTGKNATPDYFGGFTNTFSWKGIDLSFMFYYQAGNWIYNNWAFVYESNGGFLGENQSVTQLNRWQNPGDLARFPRRGRNDAKAGTTDDADLWRGDFIRLRNLTLGYNFPTSLMNRWKLRNLRIYVQGTNLLTFSYYKGQDPEQQVNGLEDFTYPNARTLTFGLDIGL